MFHKGLKIIMENEKVALVNEVEEIDEETGGSIVTWEEVGSLFCNIQEVSNKGETLTNTNRGDIISVERVLRTPYKITEGQRIKRSDGSIYELRGVCHNGLKTILEHYQAKLIGIN